MRTRHADTRTVKTTVLLPENLWAAAKKRAVDERRDLRDVIVAALGAYLKTTPKEARRR